MCVFAAIDRSISSSLSDARDALVNAVVDCLSAYRANGSNIQPSGLVAPASLRLFPLYVLALLKQVGALYARTKPDIQWLTSLHSKAMKRIIEMCFLGEKMQGENKKNIYLEYSKFLLLFFPHLIQCIWYFFLFRPAESSANWYEHPSGRASVFHVWV